MDALDKKRHRYFQLQEYLRENALSSLRPRELEKISCHCYRNTQRTFKAIFGETIGAFQRRIRLEKAARMITYSKTSITQIAIENGFADLQSFRKAFYKQFAISPSAYRIKQKEYSDNHIQKTHLHSYPCEIISHPELFIAYRSRFGAYKPEKIELLWQSCLMDYPIEQIHHGQYGIIRDDSSITDEIHCQYDAGFAIEPDQSVAFEKAGFRTKRIMAANYLMIHHQGDYGHLESIYDFAFGRWLFETDQQFSDQPIIEHYLINPENKSPNQELETEVLFPLLD